MNDRLSCPLCHHDETEHYHRDKWRDYWQCQACELVFVPPGQQLSPAEEKAVYDRHENDIDDPGYRRFLSRLAGPLLARVPPGATGLDFGCGPGPALAAMLVEQGIDMTLYDPFYAPDTRVFEQYYDIITASEVVEHLNAPGSELERLAERLRPGGWMGIMTKRVLSRKAFAGWHYIRDLTHVAFFSETTFHWLAGHLDMQVEFPAADVALLHKPTVT
ncbi:class I SAM-dependent methyltransferase [Aidingimonas halophila]|uniref:Methyltransferase domain-containing protein n=1 Tax=Aidingimonas halophila TaxID=574349 RepID=A0A1H3EBV2_9GAMM|nr:class I SAM-dependent methyltransferase [Aidingimonas halophila]GHC33728.1 2-polyprenyl-3-methyl-5-hydroxy-6-metoxy-1,4-benzoquinol methylase [Aidingimonas halophila]SDX76186.1 Methyltransferase domain-containing protein [Aidingimonas halophila]